MDSINELLKVLAGGVITIIGFWINNVVSKRSDNDKEITIAKLNITEEEHKKLKKDLQSALDTMKELKVELQAEKTMRVRIEKKFEAVKLVFKVIFNQYALQFKDDPEQISMLEQLKEIIEE